MLDTCGPEVVCRYRLISRITAACVSDYSKAFDLPFWASGPAPLPALTSQLSFLSVNEMERAASLVMTNFAVRNEHNICLLLKLVLSIHFLPIHVSRSNTPWLQPIHFSPTDTTRHLSVQTAIKVSLQSVRCVVWTEERKRVYMRYQFPTKMLQYSLDNPRYSFMMARVVSSPTVNFDTIAECPFLAFESVRILDSF